MSEERPGGEDERIEGTEGPAPEPEADTEGHSMPMYELGLSVARERKREAERAERVSRQMEGHRRPSLLDRIRRR
jgi:hypothetical protein